MSLPRHRVSGDRGGSRMKALRTFKSNAAESNRQRPMRRRPLRFVLASLACLATVAIATPAGAITNPEYTRSLTGSSGNGSLYKSNGYLYNHFTIKDTAKD